MGKIPDFNPYRSGEFTRRSHRASAGRLSTVLAAWVVGWVMYMVAMMAMVYDGFLSVVFQAVVAAAVSGVFVAFVLMLGLILRVPSLGRAWNASPRWAVAIAVASVLVMLGGPAVGIATEYVDPETGRRFLGLHAAAALGSYAALLFAVANWPTRRRITPTADPSHD